MQEPIVTITWAGNRGVDIDDATQALLCEAYADALLGAVGGNAALLAAIFADQRAGLDDGVGHFELGNSAASMLEAAANEAAFCKLAEIWGCDRDDWRLENVDIPFSVEFQ